MSNVNCKKRKLGVCGGFQFLQLQLEGYESGEGKCKNSNYIFVSHCTYLIPTNFKSMIVVNNYFYI